MRWLHGSAYYRCVGIAVALSDMNRWDMQVTGFHGNSAIAWVAQRRRGVVRVLYY